MKLSRFLKKNNNNGSNNGLDTASEPGAGTPGHVPVHSGGYLSDGGPQAGLDAIGCLSNSTQTK